MENFFKLFDSLIQQTAQNSSCTYKKVNNDKRWKYCVSLLSCGWKVSGFDAPEENSDDIIMTWTKEGKKEISVRLTFGEQVLLSRWLEQEKNK